MEKGNRGMASVKGITLKGIKSFKGSHGHGMEASVWIDGKRLGRYYYPADGGDSTLTLTTPPIEEKFVERMSEFFDKYPSKLAGVDMFINVIMTMINLQKIYKDKLKLGYDALVAENILADIDAYIEDSNASCYSVQTEGKAISDKALEAQFAGEFRSFYVYRKPEDFDIL